ncbi:hypothetical protein BP6252_14006 [Coleophoma cylindrospora]|uniref:Heterokaryon incompatibility domain-containing protein n=1 Tax=Coleophoma cylindrospora TaxID=1849047 RepID=A0A3D8Q4G2_9HELO|nr:hypothetical protein BP6252_14006 [Coleophoma cylindrospora]
MWGNEAAKKKILLNSSEFYVGENLWDALHYLRKSGDPMPIWADAICINKEDVPERNRQLPLIKWIYFRAKTVVVWLGKKYSRYQSCMQVQTSQEVALQATSQDELQKSAVASETPTESIQAPKALALGIDEKAGMNANNEEREMVMELCADPYWNRLWIIQEIGRARQKQVCFGSLAMDWNAFIEIVTLHNSSCEGPLRLNRLLQDKYSGSHTLRKLLQDNRAALCKEPRDKIYGLVGLAADAIGFPVDYRKSLIEIWKDTMEFMNCRDLLPESDIIPFGGLLKSLLIGTSLGPLEQALQPYELRPNSALVIEDSSSPRVFKLQAYIVGCIIAIGPSTGEIISSMRKADEWAAEIQQNFGKELGDAHRENDILMHTIQDSDDECLASTCFSHVSNIRWSGSLNFTITNCYEFVIRDNKARYGLSHSYGQLNDTLPAAINSHLFLVKNPWRIETPWKMGIASRLAQPGDLVCWVRGVERALILRVTLGEYKHNFQVFGTALFTNDIENHDPHHATRLSWFREGEKLALQIDSTTIYVLLA